MAFRVAIAGVLWFCIIASCLGATTQIPRLKVVPYEAWGVEISVPRESRKSVVEPKGDVLLWEMHASDDFVYFIRINKIPPDSLTSTVIEQDIQADSNLFSRRGATRRWEIASAQGELFKGLNYYAKVETDIPEAALELNKVLKGRTAYVSSAMAPLEGDTSPILVVGVVGPKGREGEVDALAKFLVHGVRKKTAGPADAQAAAPVKPVVPVPVRRPPVPPPPPVLRKGQIRIQGPVESLGGDGKSLMMTAEEISTVNESSVKLDPPRSKKVLVDSIPPWVSVGARIIVIGPNSGVGVPIKADYIGPETRQPNVPATRVRP